MARVSNYIGYNALLDRLYLVGGIKALQAHIEKKKNTLSLDSSDRKDFLNITFCWAAENGVYALFSQLFHDPEINKTRLVERKCLNELNLHFNSEYELVSKPQPMDRGLLLCAAYETDLNNINKYLEDPQALVMVRENLTQFLIDFPAVKNALEEKTEDNIAFRKRFFDLILKDYSLMNSPLLQSLFQQAELPTDLIGVIFEYRLPLLMSPQEDTTKQAPILNFSPQSLKRNEKSKPHANNIVSPVPRLTWK